MQDPKKILLFQGAVPVSTLPMMLVPLKEKEKISTAFTERPVLFNNFCKNTNLRLPVDILDVFALKNLKEEEITQIIHAPEFKNHPKLKEIAQPVFPFSQYSLEDENSKSTLSAIKEILIILQPNIINNDTALESIITMHFNPEEYKVILEKAHGIINTLYNNQRHLSLRLKNAFSKNRIKAKEDMAFSKEEALYLKNELIEKKYIEISSKINTQSEFTLNFDKRYPSVYKNILEYINYTPTQHSFPFSNHRDIFYDNNLKKIPHDYFKKEAIETLYYPGSGSDFLTPFFYFSPAVMVFVDPDFPDNINDATELQQIVSKSMAFKNETREWTIEVSHFKKETWDNTSKISADITLNGKKTSFIAYRDTDEKIFPELKAKADIILTRSYTSSIQEFMLLKENGKYCNFSPNQTGKYNFYGTEEVFNDKIVIMDCDESVKSLVITNAYPFDSENNRKILMTFQDAFTQWRHSNASEINREWFSQTISPLFDVFTREVPTLVHHLFDLTGTFISESLKRLDSCQLILPEKNYDDIKNKLEKKASALMIFKNNTLNECLEQISKEKEHIKQPHN